MTSMPGFTSTSQAAVLVFALVLLLAFVPSSSEEIPHVNACNFCQNCLVDNNSDDNKDGGPVDVLNIMPDLFAASKADILMKQLMPNCTVCRGCNTKLSSMAAESVLFNVTYSHERGASPNWIFKASTTQLPEGVAVAKVACVPIKKRAGGSSSPVCHPEPVAFQMKLLMAIEKLSEECGFTDLIPKVWVAKVNAVMPEHGFHIRWHGLWMRLVDGISFENFQHKGSPKQLPASKILDIMHNTLNHTQIIRAAIFDLLTCQCDRHSQNIFISESGQLTLIDNDWALQNFNEVCAFNSIFLPTSQKQEIIRFGNEFVLKHVAAQIEPGKADPQLLLDYRCYLPDGKAELGTDYPPQIKQCLSKISSMTVLEVQQHYGLKAIAARNLHSRATDMSTKGFEWTIKFGMPRNPAPLRYLVQPKCCEVVLGPWSGPSWKCAHDWKPVAKIPFGDPFSGKAWSKPKPDTGTFDGAADLVGIA